MKLLNFLSGIYRAGSWVLFSLVFWMTYIPGVLLSTLSRFLMRHGFRNNYVRALECPGQWFVNAYSTISLRLFGVKLVIEHGKQYTRHQRTDDNVYVLLYNHLSNFDSLIVGEVFGDAKYIFKSSINLAFFFTLPSLYNGFISVDRSTPESRARSAKALVVNVKEAEYSMAIAPEGTRNKGDPLKLLPFKRGAFNVSVESGRPVLPILHFHTLRLWDKEYLKIVNKPGYIVVRILDPIYPLENETVEEMQERVRGIMQESMNTPPEYVEPKTVAEKAGFYVWPTIIWSIFSMAVYYFVH